MLTKETGLAIGLVGDYERWLMESVRRSRGRHGVTGTMRYMTLLVLAVALGWVVTWFAGGRAGAVVADVGSEAGGEAGLVVAFEDSAGGHDRRRDRRAALYVPADAPATPFLEPGPFAATWRGQLNVPMRDRYRFAFEGTGAFELSINGQVVLGRARGDERVVSEPVRLEKGVNEMVAVYRSPEAGEAQVRLLWSSPDFPLQPVPPEVYSHEAGHGADQALARRERVRLGRAVLAEHRCVRCHNAPPDLVGQSAMPELMMDAPGIIDVGLRLREQWLAAWLADPQAVRHDATMPKFFHGEGAEQAARDVAAYLVTLKYGAVAEASTPVVDDAATVKRGGELYASLGCVGCHELSGQEPAADRVSLARIGVKFRGPALREYLQNPAQRYGHTRMGDFDLSRDEADAIAAFLLDQSERPAEPFDSGDAERGEMLAQQSGCINCHALPVVSTMDVPSLAAWMEADWSRGCVAAEAERRGEAPELPLDDVERRALRALVEAGFDSLSQRSGMEFAARQMHRLRCNACHEVDGERDTWSVLAWQVAHLVPPPPEGEAGTPAIDQSRPPLTWLGEKLRPQWMRELLRGDLDQKPRPWLRARMPGYAAVANQGLVEGMAMLHGLSPDPQPLAEPDPPRAKLGERLVGQRWGFSCTDCHGVGDYPPQNVFGAIGNNFEDVAQRLRRDYFHQWMAEPSRIMPRTKMPRYGDDDGYTALSDVLDGDARKQYEAIWHYLLTQPNGKPSATR